MNRLYQKAKEIVLASDAETAAQTIENRFDLFKKAVLDARMPFQEAATEEPLIAQLKEAKLLGKIRTVLREDTGPHSNAAFDELRDLLLRRVR